MNVSLPKNIGITIPPQMQSRGGKYLSEAGLIIIVAGLFIWFLVLPKKAEVDALKLDLVTVQVQQSKVEGDLNKLKELIDSLNSHQKEVGRLDQALPLSGRPIEFQMLLQSLADSVGLTVGDLNISGKNNTIAAGDKALLSDPYGAQRTLGKLTGTVYVQGQFSQLEAFLKKIENSGRLIDVTSVTIDGNSDGKLNLKLGIDSYILTP